MLLALLATTWIGYQAGAQVPPEPHRHLHDHAHGVPGELPSPYPDRIALTWSDDPASTLSVTWRTDATVSEAVAQVALARAAPSFYTRAETVEALTQTLDLSEIEGEHVKANYHSMRIRS